MARARKNGGSFTPELRAALTMMIQGQALLTQQLATLDIQRAETRKLLAEYGRRIDERLRGIMSILQEIRRSLDEIGRILKEHSRMLADLPDAICERLCS